MQNPKAVSLLMRIGVASTLLYAALASFAAPENWIGYFPPFIRALVPGQVLLTFFSIYELIVGIWLLSNWKVIISASLSALTMLGIIFFNFNALDIVFRDFAILATSLAIVVSVYKR